MGINKTERILNLVSYLLKSREPVPWKEISGRVVGYDDSSINPKSLERRFERDKQTLKEMGIPIEYIPPGHGAREGYLVSPDAVFLNRVEIKPHESLLLNLIGSQVAKSRSPYARALHSALRKIQVDNPEPYHDPDELPSSFTVAQEEEQDDPILSQLEILGDALLRNKRVKFTYYTLGSGKTRERTVDPYGVALDLGAWYLCGYDRDAKDMRVFRVSRIQGEIKIAKRRSSGPDFEIPEDFDVTRHIGKRPWHMGAESERTRIRIDGDVAFLIRDELGPEAEIEKKADGSIEAVFEIRSRRGLLRWVRRHIGRIEILEPEDLRRDHLDVLRNVYEMYAS